MHATDNDYMSHNDTAGFRDWGSKLCALLDNAGFVQSDDTGQIDWATADKPAENTAAGYRVYYLDDSLHDTHPIYFKLEFGTGDDTGIPLMWLTVGKGSNGAGGVTSVLIPRRSLGSDRHVISNVTKYPSYACTVDGCAWFLFRAGGRATSEERGFFAFFLARVVDVDGEPTGEGFVFLAEAGDSNSNHAAKPTAVNYETGLYITPEISTAYGGHYSFNPYSLVGVGSGGETPTVNVTRHYCAIPFVRPLGHCVSSPDGSMLPAGVEFECAVLGPPRNFISVGKHWSHFDTICLIWE